MCPTSKSSIYGKAKSGIGPEVTLSLFRFFHAPDVEIIFLEDCGKGVMAIVAKEDERIHERKQITDRCNATIEAKRQTSLEFNVSLRN